MRTVLLATLTLAVASCKQDAGTTHSKADNVPLPPAEKHCYAYSTDNDMIGLTLEIRGNDVQGNLAYALDGFDRTAGTITGTISGDTLFAEYRYVLNGLRTIREIAFLREEAGLLEVSNPTVEQEGKLILTNRSNLKFSHNFPLTKVPCERPG